MNAFSASLRSLINDYYLSLVQLESEYRERSLSLQKLLYFVRPTMHIFEILAGITGQLDKYDDLNGANLLTFLYEKITSLTGDLNSQRIIIHLTKMTAAPYISMLRLWMLKGAIIDSQDEFMVKDNEILHRDGTDLNHYSAEYWEKRYILRRDKTPKFLEPLSDCILRTGKYLNVIRQCVDHTNACDNELIFSPDNLTTLTHFVQDAYKVASETLLKVLVKDNDLMGHLLSIKKYLLLEAGDFINQFMDASDRELAKNVDKILPMKLDNLLGLTLRVASTKFDEYKDDLHCQLFPFELVKQMEKIHLAGCTYDDYWHGDKINLTGLECFSFRYDVKWPISLILNHYAIIQYQMLFRQLFYCKHVERQLCKLWKDNNNTKKFSPETAELYRSAFILRQRMMSAIQNIEYYMMIEVIEPAWLEFVAKIEKVSDVDDVLLIHQDFLAVCLHNCMLKSPDLLRAVVKLCNICLNFCKFMQRAQLYFIDAELTSMVQSDDSNDSDSDAEPLSHMQQSESSLAPTETFSERIKRFDLEFTFQLIGLMKKINDSAFDTHSSKLVNLVHRINFNSFYKQQLEQISCTNDIKISL
ncbi:hypothetical protein HA402_012460 [Bradysia odoriphaga]|nr:hypothetical protein HA402_012460 [Bradysia odoriphaga]